MYIILSCILCYRAYYAIMHTMLSCILSYHAYYEMHRCKSSALEKALLSHWRESVEKNLQRETAGLEHIIWCKMAENQCPRMMSSLLILSRKDSTSSWHASLFMDSDVATVVACVWWMHQTPGDFWQLSREVSLTVKKNWEPSWPANEPRTKM